MKLRNNYEEITMREARDLGALSHRPYSCPVGRLLPALSLRSPDNLSSLSRLKQGCLPFLRIPWRTGNFLPESAIDPQPFTVGILCLLPLLLCFEIPAKTCSRHNIA